MVIIRGLIQQAAAQRLSLVVNPTNRVFTGGQQRIFCSLLSRPTFAASKPSSALHRSMVTATTTGTSQGSKGQATNAPTSELLIEAVPCLKDNYAWLLRDAGSGVTAIVDPSEAGPVVAALAARGLTHLDYILNTHHHWDHTGGNNELRKKFGSRVVGPAADRDRIPGIEIALADGDTWWLGGAEMRVLSTPGHTRGHASFWFPAADALFSGDTLFSLGCGRLFEGTPEQMWASLGELRKLPPSTRVFCGHEYTQSNAKFAASVDPSNQALAERCREIDTLRAKGLATVPSLLSVEIAANPFLRPESPQIRAKLGVSAGASDVEAFAAIRKAKDKF